MSDQRTDHRCGPSFGGAKCGTGRCCSIFGWCGSANETHCGIHQGFNSAFNGPKQSMPRIRQHCTGDTRWGNRDPLYLNIGLHNISWTGDAGVSEVDVPAGFTVILYQGPNATGSSTKLVGPVNIPCLVGRKFENAPNDNIDMNDNVKSIEVYESSRDQKQVIDDANAKIQALEKERTSLQTQVTEVTSNLAAVTEKLKASTTSNQALINQQKILEQQLNTAKQSLDARSQQIQILTQEKHKLVQELTAKQNELGAAGETIKTLQIEKKVMFDQYNEKVKALQESQKTIDALKTVDAGKTKEFESSKQELLKEINELRALYAQASEKQKETAKQLEQANVTIQKERTAKQSLQTELQNTTATMAILRQEYTNKLASLEVAKQKEVSAIQSNSTAAIEAARRERDTIEKDLSAIQGKYTVATTQINQLRKELTSEQTAKQSLQASLDDATASMTRLRQEYTTKMASLVVAKQKEVDAIQSNSTAAIEAARRERDTIEKELSAIQGKYTVATTQINQLRKELTSEQTAKKNLEDELDRSRQSMSSLRSEYEVTMRELETAKNKEIEAIRSNSKTAVDAAVAERQVIEKKLQAIEGKYTASLEYTKTLEVNLQQERIAKEEAQSQLQDLKTALVQLGDDYAGKILELQQTQTILRQAYEQGDLTEVQYLKKLVASLENEISMMKGQYESSQKRVQVLERELASAQSERDMARQTSLKTTEALKQLRDEYDRKIAALETARAKETLALKTQNASLATEAQAAQKALRAEINAISGKYNTAMAEIKSLEGQVTTERDLNTALTKQLQDNQAQMTRLRDEYQQKIAALNKAMEDEKRALETRNQTQIEESRAVQASLREEINAIVGKYNTASQQIKTLEGQVTSGRVLNTSLSSQLQDSREQMYEMRNQYERRISETNIDIYVLVDSKSWINEGQLKVLTMNGDRIQVEPFQYRKLGQAWTTKDGYIRSLDGEGQYVSTDDGCLLPRGTRGATTSWKFQGTRQYAREYVITSTTCKRDISVSQGVDVSLQDGSIEKSSWFVIPVGKINGNPLA